MALVIDERYTAVNYTVAADVPATWGYGERTIDFLTIHWWGSPVGQTYESILGWFCGWLPAVASTSCHYVTSRLNAACIVSPWDAAWHAGGAHGNKHGNVNSIGIEVDPTGDDETYQTTGALIAHLWSLYGRIIPLKPHGYWTATTCPGAIDLDRLYAIALSIYNNTEKEDVMPSLEDIFNYPVSKLGNDLEGKKATGTTTLKSVLANYDSNLFWSIREARMVPEKLLDTGIVRAELTGTTSLRKTISHLDNNLTNKIPTPLEARLKAIESKLK